MATTTQMPQLVMYALRFVDTGDMVGFTSDTNEGEFCYAIRFELDRSYYTNNIWVVTDRATAERAANTHTEWYNANYTTPENPFVGMLEVVELGVK